MFTQNGLDYIRMSLSTWGPFGTARAYDGTQNVAFQMFSNNYDVWPFRPGITSGQELYAAGMYQISNNTNVFYGNSFSTSSPSQWGVIIGDGDTTPTVNDYKLSGNQITTFSATTAISTSVVDGKIEIVATYNITNTGSDAFTVKEIGITRRSQYSAPQYRILLTHDLLAVPVTIEPGATGVVTYKMVFNLNDAA